MDLYIKFLCNSKLAKIEFSLYLKMNILEDIEVLFKNSNISPIIYSDIGYTSKITKIRISSIFDTFQKYNIIDFLNNKEIWYNVKNHFRTEQIVELCNNNYIYINELNILNKKELITIDNYFIILYIHFITKMNNKIKKKYNRRKIDSSIQIGKDVYNIINECITEFLDSKSVNVASHIYEYMAHLAIIAAMRASADSETIDYFSWTSSQMAILIIIGDAITEYNLVERDVTYAHIYQTLISRLLSLASILDNNYAVMTEEQREPSIIKQQFWKFNSDLEHRSSQIIGSETNAAFGLYRSIILGDTKARSLTLFNLDKNIELSRRVQNCERISYERTIYC